MNPKKTAPSRSLNRAHRQAALHTLTVNERRRYLREETFSRAVCATMGHPVARLWRKFADKKIAELNKRYDEKKSKYKAQKKSAPSALTEGYEKLIALYSNGLNANAPGWKSFKKAARL